MTTAVAAVICLAFGGFVGYVTGAVLTSNKYIDKMEVLWQQLRNSTRRIGELESKLKAGGGAWRRSHVMNAVMNLTATR